MAADCITAKPRARPPGHRVYSGRHGTAQRRARGGLHDRRARPVGGAAARRPRRRRHQGRAPRGRHHAPARPDAEPRHGGVLSGRQPQQALDRARPQAGGRARGAAPARRGRRRAAPQLPAAGRAPARDVVRDVPRDQSGHRLRRHLRLPGRRALRRQAGLRRHHPGRLRPGLAPGLDHGRAALRADDRRRQDELDDGAGRGARRPLPQGAHRRGPGGRGADVREHGRLGDGRAPLRRDLRAAASTRSATSGSSTRTGARSRRRTATSRSCRTRTRTGETSSRSPAGRTCSTIRATRRSRRGSGTSRSCTRSWRRSRSPGRTPSGWPSSTGAIFQR